MVAEAGSVSNICTAGDSGIFAARLADGVSGTRAARLAEGDGGGAWTG